MTSLDNHSDMMIGIYSSLLTLVPSILPQGMNSSPHSYTKIYPPCLQPSFCPSLEESETPRIVLSVSPSVVSSYIPSRMPSEFQLKLSTSMPSKTD